MVVLQTPGEETTPPSTRGEKYTDKANTMVVNVNRKQTFRQKTGFTLPHCRLLPWWVTTTRVLTSKLNVTTKTVRQQTLVTVDVFNLTLLICFKKVALATFTTRLTTRSTRTGQETTYTLPQAHPAPTLPPAHSCPTVWRILLRGKYKYKVG